MQKKHTRKIDLNGLQCFRREYVFLRMSELNIRKKITKTNIMKSTQQNSSAHKHKATIKTITIVYRNGTIRSIQIIALGVVAVTVVPAVAIFTSIGFDQYV